MPFRKPPTHASVTTATISAEMEELDEILAGGSTNAGLVIRVGDTVRRPLRPTSASAHARSSTWSASAFSGAPRFLGIDQLGREILSYVPGTTAVRPYPAWATSDAALASVGRLLREYHEAVAGLRPDRPPLGASTPAGVPWQPRMPQRPGNGQHRLLRWPRRGADRFRPRRPRPDRLGPRGVHPALGAVHGRARAPAAAPARAGAVGDLADAYGADEAEREDLVAAMIPCHSWCQEIVAEKGRRRARDLPALLVRRRPRLSRPHAPLPGRARRADARRPGHRLTRRWRPPEGVPAGRWTADLW